MRDADAPVGSSCVDFIVVLLVWGCQLRNSPPFSWEGLFSLPCCMARWTPLDAAVLCGSLLPPPLMLGHLGVGLGLDRGFLADRRDLGPLVRLLYPVGSPGLADPP